MSIELFSHVTENESFVIAGIYFLGVISGLGAAWLANTAIRIRRTRTKD